MRSSRRERAAETYARRGPSRAPYDTVLILCEGEKTEPNYFSGLRSAYRLSSANIRIVPAEKSDPLGIVSIAESELANYDRVFCVFDRDSHAGYRKAVSKIERSEAGTAGRLSAITSCPCFEVWVLLHFRFSTAPFNASGGNSPCDNVIREIKKHLPSYEKRSPQTFGVLLPHLQTALTYAENLSLHNENSGSTNPSTRVHSLVSYLIGLNAK
jgi:hypothetical protein